MNNIASHLGDVVCVGISALDITVLNANCAARSSTITMGYLALMGVAIVVIALFIKSRRPA